MQQKGQASFETLLVMLVVLSITIFLSSYYLAIHEDTVAISAARNAVLEQINQKTEEITIEYVKIVKTQTEIQINIKLSETTSINTEAIKNKVLEKANYDKDKLVINIAP
jgi:uncharacterized protein (UPF0333 family)